MKTRQFRYPYRRRSRGVLWLFLGLAFGLGAFAVLFGRRRETGKGPVRRTPEEPDEEIAEREYPEPAPPESLAVWIPGPAGNLYVRDGGPHSGASSALPILFLHSLAGNGGQWALQLDHLRRYRRAVALDFRGHGDSDPAEDADYSIPALTSDVEAAADQLGLRRFVLAGHSLGSAPAIEYASRHPDRVAGLLLVDPNGDQSQVPREQMEPFLEALRRDPLGELESYFRQLVAGGDPDASRWVVEDVRLTHEEAIVRAIEGSIVFQPLPALARYSGPKLSIISDMNNLPFSLHRLMPSLPVRLMTGTGHWLMMDRPEVLNHLVDEFLAQVEAPL